MRSCCAQPVGTFAVRHRSNFTHWQTGASAAGGASCTSRPQSTDAGALSRQDDTGWKFNSRGVQIDPHLPAGVLPCMLPCAFYYQHSWWVLPCTCYYQLWVVPCACCYASCGCHPVRVAISTSSTHCGNKCELESMLLCWDVRAGRMAQAWQQSTACFPAVVWR